MAVLGQAQPKLSPFPLAVALPSGTKRPAVRLVVISLVRGQTDNVAVLA
jgi:hypothetical protein